MLIYNAEHMPLEELRELSLLSVAWAETYAFEKSRRSGWPELRYIVVRPHADAVWVIPAGPVPDNFKVLAEGSLEAAHAAHRLMTGAEKTLGWTKPTDKPDLQRAFTAATHVRCRYCRTLLVWPSYERAADQSLDVETLTVGVLRCRYCEAT